VHERSVHIENSSGNVSSTSLFINMANVSANGIDLLPSPSVGRSVGLSVCMSVRGCTVAKRLIGSGCRLGWWVWSVRDGCT